MTDSPQTASMSLGRRIAAHWPLKVGGTILFIFLATVGYLLPQRFPIREPVPMPMTALDRAIGFHPETVYLYLTVFVLMPIPAFLMTNRRDAVRYGLGLIGLSAVSWCIFFLWPTLAPRPESAPLTNPGFGFLASVDGPGNACPSLHAASAVFAALCLTPLLRKLGDRGLFRVLTWIWCVAILYTTLATKQHVVYDVVAGSGLAVAVYHIGRCSTGMDKKT